MRHIAHTCITILGITAVVGFFSATTVSAETPVSSYTVTRTTGAITVDGKLTEADWIGAAETGMTNTLNGEPIALKSTVKMLWDDTYLYVGFTFEDPDAWATITTEDGALWDEEVAEVFIDPENKGHSYYEFEVNPINQKVDLFVLNQGPRHNGNYKTWIEWDFSPKLKKAVWVDGDGKAEGTADKVWTVELAFPFEDLWTAASIPPKDGDVWRIGLYRIEQGKSSTRTDDWYAAFSPTLNGSFHTPWRFGNVSFKK